MAKSPQEMNLLIHRNCLGLHSYSTLSVVNARLLTFVEKYVEKVHSLIITTECQTVT